MESDCMLYGTTVQPTGYSFYNSNILPDVDLNCRVLCALALNVLYQFALKSGDFTSSSAAAAPFRKMGDGMGRRTNGIELMTRREN